MQRRRYRGWIALAAWCCLPLCALRAAHAADAARVLVSGRYRYSVSYPASWQPLHVAGATFAALAPDRNAVISISTQPGRAGRGALRAALAQVFAPFGHPVQAPVYDTIRLHGATGVLVRDLVATPRGQRSGVVAVAISRQGRLYTLLGVVLDTAASTAASDTNAVLGIIGGVSFF